MISLPLELEKAREAGYFSSKDKEEPRLQKSESYEGQGDLQGPSAGLPQQGLQVHS